MNRLLDALLAPIARLAVAKGVLFPQVAERLKLQFLHAAEGEQASTDSRVSVMTGLQRRDIGRLRDLPDEAPDPVNHLARLVMVWRSVFDGKPLARSGENSFASLAAMIRKDVHPRTLLEQLVAAGTVEMRGDQAHVVALSYQPLAGSEGQLDYLAANGGDYLSAAVANITHAPAPYFERAAHFNHLSADAVAELDALYREKQMAVLVDVGEVAKRLQETSQGTMRFRAGGYFYIEDEI